MNSSPGALSRGDLIIAVFPFTDLSSAKRRPAVVLAAEVAHPDLLLAFISSVLPPIVEPTDLLLLPADADFTQTGLKVPSVIRLDKLATIERSLVTRRIGRLLPQRLQTVDDKLAVATGIDINRYRGEERRRLLQIYTNRGAEALIQELRR